MGQLINTKELLDKRSGEPGTASRERIREEAFSYYFGEIIRNRRKELKLSQSELAELVEKKTPLYFAN